MEEFFGSKLLVSISWKILVKS